MTGHPVLRRTAAAATVLAAAVLTGCGPTIGTDLPSDDPTSATTPRPGPDGDGARGRGTSRETAGAIEREVEMEIEIRVGDETFTATVDDTPAGRDLLDQLPQTIEMSDHGGVEKTGRLESPLRLDGQPPGADPAVGDLGYYAPGNDLVLYYGDQSYYDGIVVLGRLEDSAPSRLARMSGGVTVSVTDVS